MRAVANKQYKDPKSPEWARYEWDLQTILAQADNDVLRYIYHITEIFYPNLLKPV